MKKKTPSGFYGGVWIEAKKKSNDTEAGALLSKGIFLTPANPMNTTANPMNRTANPINTTANPMNRTANPMNATANPMIAGINTMTEGDIKLLEEYTPLTAEALARFNVDATGHMDKRLLDKEEYLKGIKQRRDVVDPPVLNEEDRRRADLEEEDRQVSVALQLSMDDTKTPGVATPMNLVKPKTDDKVAILPVLPGGRDEDENINRLITNEDTKSVVSQWGRRTDQGSESHKDNKEQVHKDEGNDVKVAIREYVGDYEEAWPLLLEPDEDFCVVAGQIPVPLDLGNLGRRMVSVMTLAEHPAIKHWDKIENKDRYISKEMMVIAYDYYIINKQMRDSYVIPKEVSIEPNRDLVAWAHQVSLRSPFTQALLMCRDEAYELIRGLEAYVKAAKLRSSNYEMTFVLPTLVKQTDAEARRIIHGVDQLFRKIGGEQQDQVNWRNGSSCYLTKSDQFLRLLHNYIANFMKSFEVNNVEQEYPWLVRYTENIFRDAPSQFNLYAMWVHKYPRQRIRIKKVRDYPSP